MIARLFAYSLAVSIMLIPLYLTVKWVMGGLTFHRLTRLMLTGSIVASLLLPFAAGMIDGLLVHGGSGVTAEAGLPQIGGIAAGPVESQGAHGYALRCGSMPRGSWCLQQGRWPVL